jgi:hypothetical protein
MVFPTGALCFPEKYDRLRLTPFAAIKSRVKGKRAADCGAIDER